MNRGTHFNKLIIIAWILGWVWVFVEIHYKGMEWFNSFSI